MALTDTDIANMALARIGYSALQISSLTEDSPEAAECNFWFDKKRDEILENWPWEVFQKWTTLTLVEEQPNDDWGYSYRYPVDCVFALDIQLGGLATRYHGGNRVPMSTGTDDTGRLIYTDQSPAILHYTARRTETAFWSASFGSAFAWGLATELVVPLARDISLQVNAQKQFDDALKQAESNSANEITDDPEEEATAISVRNGDLGDDYYRNNPI